MLTLKDTSVSEAIYQLAKLAKLNVIVKTYVPGSVTLELYQASPRQALDLILISHNLSKWKQGNIWLIETSSDAIKHAEEYLKTQASEEQSLPLVTHFWQVKFRKASEIAEQIRTQQASFLSPRGLVQVDTGANILIVRDTSKQLAIVQKLVKNLDFPAPQVIIEARMESIDSDCEAELGLAFRASEHMNKDKKLSQLISLASMKLADSHLLDVKLTALERAGHAELISSPRLFTTNQHTASIESGEEVPYQEVSESGGTAVAFKKAVLSLKVTPHVLPGKKVLLHLQINQDRPSSRLIQGVPTISTRQINTDVMVKLGKTVVLGGIYESTRENVNKGIPFLQNLPVLGWLFKDKHTRSNKRLLYIFVTPKIVAYEI